MISEHAHIILEAICRAAACVQGVTIPEILGEERTDPIVTARQLAIHVAVSKMGINRTTAADYFKRSETYVNQVVGGVTLALGAPGGFRQIAYKIRAIEFLLKTDPKCQSNL